MRILRKTATAFREEQQAGPFSTLQQFAHNHISRFQKRFSSKADLRREKRESKKVSVYYKFVGLPIPWDTARTVDLSDNGACIIANRKIEVGQYIDLEIAYKTAKTRKITKVSGKVVWVDALRGKLGHYKHGICFQEKEDTFTRENNLLWQMADKHCYVMKNYTRDCQGHPAQNIEQLKEAYQLVYREYVARRLCEPNVSQMHCNSYSLLPNTKTFLLRKDKKLLGTIALIPDSHCGVPMDIIYKEAIDQLRAQGRKVAEVGMLSLNSQCFDRKHHSFKSFQKQAYLFKLMKTMFDYARFIEKVDDLIIGVHPKHQFLYEYLNFQAIGEVKSYPGACGKPAVLMRMDIETVVRNNILLNEGPGVYFLHGDSSLEVMKRHFSWTAQTLKEFILEIKPIWNTFKDQQKHYVEYCYPSLNHRS